MTTRWAALAVTIILDLIVVAAVVPLFGVMAAANVFIAILMLKGAVFVALYGLRSNWRQTAGGRAVMALMACITVICMIGTAGAYFGDYPGRAYVRLVAFIAIGTTLMNLLLTLIEAQRGGQDDQEDDS